MTLTKLLKISAAFKDYDCDKFFTGQNLNVTDLLNNLTDEQLYNALIIIYGTSTVKTKTLISDIVLFFRELSKAESKKGTQSKPDNKTYFRAIWEALNTKMYMLATIGKFPDSVTLEDADFYIKLNNDRAK